MPLRGHLIHRSPRPANSDTKRPHARPTGVTRMTPKRHHYVPEFLLRNFADDDKIWLFDKHTSKVFRTSIKNAFVEGHFNTVVADKFTLEAEQIFTRAEATAAPILNDIIEKKTVKHLDEEAYAAVTVFVTIQHLRTKQARRTFKLFREHMTKRFPGIPQSELGLPNLTAEEGDKYASLDFIVNNLSEFSQAIGEKTLILVERNCPGSFWISDHPVVLHNDNAPHGDRSIGLKVPGVQVFMPISPKYALAYFCQTILEELEQGIAKIDAIRSRRFADWFKTGTLGDAERLTMTNLNYKREIVAQTFRALKTDRKIQFNEQNLIFLNSKQVISGFRFVASAARDFSLVVDMLEKSPELRMTDHLQFA